MYSNVQPQTQLKELEKIRKEIREILINKENEPNPIF
jgi:hypothetical protein